MNLKHLLNRQVLKGAVFLAGLNLLLQLSLPYLVPTSILIITGSVALIPLYILVRSYDY